MNPKFFLSTRSIEVLAAILFAESAFASVVTAQSEVLAASSFTTAESRFADDDGNALERGRYAILVDLDENRLYFKQGDETLWSAPIGTGTGMRVITHDDDWDFSTPTGRFQIQYKERDPVWIAPDWYFVENNLPVPPKNHPSRYMRGTLGDAAVYIAPDLAIHGTNRPELIGQRVSHGCIRLENRYARRLYHNVQVGTEVIIVGGEDVVENARTVDLREGYDPSLASSGGRKPLPKDPTLERWRKMETADLADELDEEFEKSAARSRWDEVAIILLERARGDDAEALTELLNRVGSLPNERIEREWATFLADVYRRNTLRTLEALASLDVRQRRQAAGMLVMGSITLYSGEPDSVSAPWPTSRIHEDLVSRGGERGWTSLQAAERDHRARIRTAAARN